MKLYNDINTIKCQVTSNIVNPYCHFAFKFMFRNKVILTNIATVTLRNINTAQWKALAMLPER